MDKKKMKKGKEGVEMGHEKKGKKEKHVHTLKWTTRWIMFVALAVGLLVFVWEPPHPLSITNSAIVPQRKDLFTARLFP